MNLSPDLKRLAEIVYPGQKVLERDFGVVVRPKHGENNLPDMFQFKPSLTGEDWQQAQALDCLKALAAKGVWYRNEIHDALMWPMDHERGFWAACRCLLSGGGR